MSWFKRNKNQPLIPPVDQPQISRLTATSSESLPSYRSTAGTYVASRDGDLSDPRAYGNLPSSYRQNSDGYSGNGGGYGDATLSPNFARQHSEGYRAGANYDNASPDQSYAPQSQYRSRSGYGVTGGVSDHYARGERDLNADRNALFAGSAPFEENQGDNRFADGPAGQTAAEEEEENVEAIKTKTRDVKNSTVASTRNALRVAREAEETGRATLLRLGEQSEKIADTERHLDVSKGHAIRADDNADEIKKLNRSIFIPAITFNKDAKRQAQERKRVMRYQEEMTERELAMQDIRESQNRVGRAATYGRANGGGDDNGEGIGGYRHQKTVTEQKMRKEQRKRYQFEATGSDDELEDEIDDNLDEIFDVTKRMKSLGLAMGSELQSQNSRLTRITGKADKLGIRVDANTAKLNRITR